MNRRELLIGMGAATAGLTIGVPRLSWAASVAVGGRIISIDPGSLVSFGRGYDTLSGRFRANVVESTPVAKETPDGGAGQNTTFSMQKVTSSTELKSQLNVSASASFSGGVGSVSAKTSYAKTSTLNKYSVYLVVKVTVVNVVTRLSDFRLTKDALGRLGNMSAPDLFETFGNGFVAGVTTGGELLGVIQFVAQDSSQQQDIAASVEGHTGSFSSSGEFKKSLSEVTKNTDTRLWVSKVGGTGPVPSTIDALIDNAASFPDQAQRNPVPYTATLQDFAAIVDFPQGQKIPDLNAQLAAVQQLAASRDYADTQKASWQYVKDHPRQFTPELLGQADNAMPQLDEIIASINERGEAILLHPFSPLPNAKAPIAKELAAPLAPASVRLDIVAHVHNTGDLSSSDGATAGLPSSGFIEGFSIKINPPVDGLGIEYMAHLADQGDTGWAKDGDFVGTRNLSRPMEAFRIRLTGAKASAYQVDYTAHVIGVGDRLGCRDGSLCSNGGESLRVDKMWVKVSPRK